MRDEWHKEHAAEIAELHSLRGLYRAVHAADSTLCAGRRCGRLLLLLDETLMAACRALSGDSH